jgi:hypothetical protein
VKIERICPSCGKHFFVDASRIKHGRGIYCSKKCQYGSRKNNKTEYKCDFCGKIFKRYSSSIKSKYHFCSAECAYEARGVGLVKRVIKTPYKCYRKPFRVCPICGSDFIYKKSSQVYCSRKCYDKSLIISMRGENNPSYIDGRSKNKKCYRGDDWEYIRKDVYKRDGYKCRVCRKHCGRKEIQCHHIVKYKETFDNSMDNLVTVCNKCHPDVEEDSSLIIKLEDM